MINSLGENCYAKRCFFVEELNAVMTRSKKKGRSAAGRRKLT